MPVDPKIARIGLIAAGGVGLAAALWSALGGGGLQPLPPGGPVIARVDGVDILRADYDLAVEALTLDKRNPLTSEDRARALNRLIDEALLVQRGLDMGLGETDPAARKAIVQAMLQFATQAAAARMPQPGELDAFAKARPELLRDQDSIRVRAISFAVADAPGAARFRAAIAAGQSFAQAAHASGGALEPIPDALVPMDRLAGVGGPRVQEAAASLNAGEVAGPISTGDRILFLYVVERRAPELRDIATSRDIVEAAWRRQIEAEAVDDQLAALRRRAAIAKAPDAPA